MRWDDMRRSDNVEDRRSHGGVRLGGELGAWRHHRGGRDQPVAWQEFDHRPRALHRPAFFDEFSGRFGTPGDFTRGCLIGHHVQTLFGVSQQVDATGRGPVAALPQCAIGDDSLQQEAQGREEPDSFTHGSTAQRLKWFSTGLQTGRIDSCNTFTTTSL
ncbi:neutral zinc metallopeptidase [Crenobacter sp. SG2303]|uniref:Neutral zinc metallopeptidase n=1 Tax=Crenobacter oryzisoli TaxID=3056844 RepID=A0ABT7XQ60_9NEIS|nr:neutral zinc metallopeptidase [Crenobacter sp. SG2303]MDN0075933.1 neutral zinc metallopeptidase [Crenobacter sp. SG2303]